MTFKTNLALARSEKRKRKMQLGVRHEWVRKVGKYSLNISRIVDMMCRVKGQGCSTVHPTAIWHRPRLFCHVIITHLLLYDAFIINYGTELSCRSGALKLFHRKPVTPVCFPSFGLSASDVWYFFRPNSQMTSSWSWTTDIKVGAWLVARVINSMTVMNLNSIRWIFCRYI